MVHSGLNLGCVPLPLKDIWWMRVDFPSQQE
jgi:hypothetical protein